MALDPKQTYCTVDQADEYWDQRGGGEWEALNLPDKEAALITSSEWIDVSFSWIGGFSDEEDQILSWPRVNAVDSDGKTRKGIPKELVRATAWMANYIKDGQVEPPQKRGGDIESVSAGPVTVNWSKNAPSGTTYRHVTKMVRKITTGGSNSVKLVRT